MIGIFNKTVIFVFLIFLVGFASNKIDMPNMDNIALHNQKPADGEDNDSIRNAYLMAQIRKYYDKDDTLLFHKSRKEHIKLLQGYSDSTSLAKNYKYAGAFFWKHNQMDSAYYYYYRSYLVYNGLKDSLNAGGSLLNLAILHKNIADYSGSENLSFQALGYLEPMDNKRRIASVFNNLGIIYNNLKNYGKAIEYHSKSAELRTEMDASPILEIQSLNNIGKMYKDMGNYGEAIGYFQKALTNGNLLEQHQETKAALIDNLADALFKSGKTDRVLEQYLEALKIREGIEDLDGILISCIHLSEYHNSKGDKETAIKYAERAEGIAMETHEYRDYLESLMLMANLYDGEKAKEKFNRYAFIKDSIDLVNKRHKEQFSRIKYEVDKKDELIEEQQKSNQNKWYWIIGLSLLVCVLLASVFHFFRKKRKQALEMDGLLEKLEEMQLKFFHSQDKELEEKNRIEFREMLIGKYGLTDSLVEFWELQIKGLSEDEISKHLISVTEEAIKKRRNKLYGKLKDYHGYSKINKFMSASIYRENFQDFARESNKE